VKCIPAPWGNIGAIVPHIKAINNKRFSDLLATAIQPCQHPIFIRLRPMSGANKLKPISIPEHSPPVSRRRFIQSSTLLAAATFTGSIFAVAVSGGRRRVDVCIYAATSGGVIAAVTLAHLGHSVLLVEPTRHIGGMTSSGLGWIDFGKASSIGGLTKTYFDDIRAYDAAAGVKSNGWSIEPHVAEMHFEKMLAECHVEVVREARLASVDRCE
jgi:hypothetical protein